MKTLRVQMYKYNGAPHYSYQVRLVEERPGLLIVHGPLNRPLTHPGRKLVDHPLPNQTIEFFFLNRPYNVVAGWNADGSFRHYYCNIATPAELHGDEIRCTDLDLDLVVAADFTYRVEDEDEFEAHRLAWGYPQDLVEMARASLAELIRLVEARAFPFDGTAERLLHSVDNRF